MSSKDTASKSSSKKSQKPTYSKFSQQELPACKPVLTPGLVIGTFILLAIAFIPIGISHLSASEQVIEISDRYDDACIPAKSTDTVAANNERARFIQDPSTDKNCIITLTVPKKMHPPIFVYYQLENFYQNHRRYVKSRSDQQYMSPKYEGVTKDCDPEALDENRKPVVPCGVIAWSLFNDTYVLSRNSAPLPINKKNISWKSDRTHKFGSNVYPKNFQNHGLIGGGKLNESIPLNEHEDLLVWMRTAALPTFRKLYGRIETELQPNENLTLMIQNNYNTYSFQGKKRFVISTATWIGGKNNFLGKMYITVGGFCILLAITFMAIYLIKPRPLGDPSYLSWNKNQQSL